MTRAPISLPNRTVIFDYGDVISLTQSAADRAVIERLAGVEADAEKFWRAYAAHRDGLDQGSAGVAAYWQAIADEIGAAWDEARVHELWVADFRSWLSVNPAVIEVLTDLRAGATRLALLSNAGPDYGSYFRHGPLGVFFEACYVSGELGLLKPHPEIYRHVLDSLSVTPAEAAFIDNRAANVAGAEAIGISGHVFTTPADLRSFLTGLAFALYMCVCGAGGLDVGEIVLGPPAHLGQQRREGLSESGERVLDAGRYDGERDPSDDPVGLQGAQRLSEHLLANPADRPLQFGVAQSAASQRVQDQGAPLVGDQVEHRP